MNFFEIFAYLTDLTSSKITDIANAISYDRTYVSKWYHKKSLPPERTWPIIRQRLTKYFSTLIKDEQLEDLAKLNSSVRYELGLSCLSTVIKSLLDDGYNHSLAEKKDRDGLRDKTNLATLLDNKDKFINFFIRSISRGLCEKARPFEIIINDNILSLMDPEILEYSEYTHTNTQTYTIKFTISLNKLGMDEKEFFKFIYNYLDMASKLPFIDFQIYGMPEDDKGPRRFVVGRSCLGWSSEISKDQMRAFVLTNPEMAKEFRKDLEADLKDHILVPRPFYNQFENYMTSSSSSTQAIFYMPEIPLCVASQDLRDRLLKDGFISGDEHRAGTKMFEFFSSDKLKQARLVLNKKGLVDLFAKGIVRGCGGLIRLNDTYLDEFRRQVEEILLDKAYSKDFLESLSYDESQNNFPRVIIYSDGDKSFYIRPIQQNPYSDERLFYTIRNDIISKKFYEYLKSTYLSSEDLLVL